MPEVHAYIEQVATLLEIVGVVIILGGVVLATIWFVRAGFRSRDRG